MIFMYNLASIEKIISTENLSYLPNLYYRKFKLIESLNYERFDFPEQKILVPRNKTKWDAVLCEMKEKAQLRKQVIKFKTVLNFHISHNSKEQFIKKQLKQQQRQLYHRIIANQLSQNILEYFQSFKQTSPALQNDEQANQKPIINNEQQKVDEKSQHDDIFIDKQNIEDDFLMNEEGDIFDDILNVGNNDNHNQKQHLGNNLNGINDSHRQNQNSVRRNINDYIKDFVNLNDKRVNNNDKIEEENQQIELSSHISRKSCLKKINENLRKRLKTKGADTEDRSLTSATVALSNLINNYPECKDTTKIIQIPSSTQWIFDDLVKNKRKKDDDFELNWPDEELEKFREMNQKFQIQKIGELPSLLQLFVTRKDYSKLFQKNISSNYQFPANVQSIRLFSDKFTRQKFYYNQFHQQSYQKFIMKNNKRKLLQKFQKNSNYIFPEHYTQDQVENNQKISAGKIFLYPPNKISDRIIYKVQPGTTKISAIVKEYNRKNLPFSRQKIILLSYLINKYLVQFGNNWKAITEFIQIFPCFSNYLIKPELVQQLYQMVTRHQLKDSYINNLQIWDKKLLPSSQIYTQSYKNYKKIVRQNKNKKIIEDEMTEQSYNSDTQNDTNINLQMLENFEDLINKPLNPHQNSKKLLKKMSTGYKQYSAKICATTTNETYNFYQNKVRKTNKIIQEYRNTYGVARLDFNEKPSNEQKISQYVQQNIKGDIKSGLPFRKKKNINERNNELVKILQALRSKNTGVIPQGVNKMPTEMIKNNINPQKAPQPPQTSQTQQAPQPANNFPNQNTQPAPASINLPLNPSALQVPSKPSQVSQGQKEQKKTKTPQKRVGGAIKKKQKKVDQQKK